MLSNVVVEVRSVEQILTIMIIWVASNSATETT
jgi:hypothetical protein